MATNRINYFRKYIKNVGKSFGYAAVDILKDYNPIVTDVFSSTKGAVTSTYNTIKDFAFSSHSESEKSLLGEIKDSSRGAFKNLLDDLKTGNWYNKARDEEADKDLMKALGFDMSDFDFDFDFDSDNWGEGDDSFTASAQSELENDKKNTAATIASMNMVGNRVANAVNEGTVRSANYISNTIKESNKAVYELTQRGFSQTLLGLNSVNGTIAEFANKIGTPLTAHMQNATIFYTKTSESLQKIEQSLATIAANTTPPAVSGSKSGTKKKPGMEDILSSSGINFGQYAEFVKASMSDYKDIVDMVVNFGKGTLGVGSGSSNMSIGKMALKGGMKALIPQIFKDSMERFNETLANTLAGALVKGSRKSSNSLLGDILRDIFIPSNYFKKDVDTGNYEKGAVAWDGKARKALVEVIPTTLFKILGALTGREQRYNYDTGKFVDVKSIQHEQDEMLRRNARSAGGQYRDKARELAKIRARGNKGLEARYLDEIENYFYNAYATDYGYKNFDRVTKSDFKRDKFGISSDEVIKILRAVIASGKADSYFRTNATTRAAQRRELLEAERSGDHIFNVLSNGSYSVEKAGSMGKKLFAKGTIGYYIKGIYEHTGYIATNLSKLGGGTGLGGTHATFASFGDFTPGKNRRRVTLASGERLQNMANIVRSSGGEAHRDEVNRVLGLEDFTSEEEYQNYLRQQNGEELKNQLTERQKNIKDKLLGIFKGMPRGIANVFQAPFNAAAKVLDSISTGFTTFLWGDPKGSDKGFFGTMKDRLSETFKSITDSFKDETKNWFKKAFEGIFGTKGEDGKRHGGFFGTGFGTEIKGELKGAADWIGDLGREILYGEQYSNAYRANRLANNGTAARGRKVTRSGIVSVSEGEMIIPSEYNPYYNGSSDKNAQIRRELNNTRRFYSGLGGIGRTEYLGNYAEGGLVFGGLQRKVGDIIAKTGKDGKVRYFQIVDKNGKLKRVTNAAGAEFSSGYRNRLDENGNLTRNVGDQNIQVGGVFGALHGAQHAAADFGREFKDRFFDEAGNEDAKKAKEKDKQALLAGLSSLGKEAKSNRGAIGAGALIGAGASLLTGGVVGPLMGASIGAAVGLTVKSDTVQRFLFGDEDHNGIFKKEFGDKVKKYAPSMAKGAAAGAIGGLFMGSPVLGAMVGSSIGYIKKSEKAQQMLFGNADNPKLLGKVRDKVKERIPGMTLGAIGGLLAGPFGVTGNLLLGSGIGFLATGDKVKDFFLGKKDSNGKRYGGFLYDFKTRVFDNVSELFHNIGNSMKGFGKKLIHNVSRHTRNLVSSIAKGIAKAAAKTRTGSRIVNFVRSIPDRVTGGLSWVTGGLSRRMQRRNLNKGYDVWDKEQGRNLTAEERVNLRRERGYSSRGTFGRFDDILQNVQSEKDLDAINEALNTIANPDKTAKQLKNDSEAMLYNGLSSVEDPRNIVKRLKSGDALAEAQRQGASEEDLELIRKAQAQYNKGNDQKRESKLTMEHWKKVLGTDKLTVDNITNLQDLLKTERSRFQSEKEKEENQPGTYKNRILSALENIAENVNKIGQHENAGTTAPPNSKGETSNQTEQGSNDLNRIINGPTAEERVGYERAIQDMQTTSANPSAGYQDDAYFATMNDAYNQYYGDSMAQYDTGWGRFKRRAGYINQVAPTVMGHGLGKIGRRIGRLGAGIGRGIGKFGIGAGKLGARAGWGTLKFGARVATSPIRFIGNRAHDIANSIAEGRDRQGYKDRELYELAKQKIDEGRGYETTNLFGGANYYEILEYLRPRIESDYERLFENIEDVDPDDLRAENPDTIRVQAYGSPFTRRGLASVSEGELIVPGPYYGNFAQGNIANGLLPMMRMMWGLGTGAFRLGKKAVKGGIRAGKSISEFYRDRYGDGDLGGLREDEFIGSDGTPGKVNDSDDDATKAFVSHVDFMGGVHQYERNEQGELVEQKNDRETDDAREKMNSIYDAITGSSKLLAAQLALAGAGYGLSAEDLKKLAGLNAGGGSQGDTSKLSGILTTILGGVGTLVGVGLGKLFKGGINKLIYGQSKVKGLSLTEKVDRIMTKWNPIYRHNVIRDELNAIFYKNYNHPALKDYKMIMEGKLNYPMLGELDDATLAKYNIMFDETTNKYIDLDTGKEFHGGYIDDQGNFHTITVDGDEVYDDIIRKLDDTQVDDIKAALNGTGNVDDIIADANKLDDTPLDEAASAKTTAGTDVIDDAIKDANKLDDTPFDEVATHGDDLKGASIHSNAADEAKYKAAEYEEWQKKSAAEKIDDVSTVTKTGNITSKTRPKVVDDIFRNIDYFDPEVAKSGYQPWIQDGTTNRITDIDDTTTVKKTKISQFGEFLKSQLIATVIILAICMAIAILGVLITHNWYKDEEATKAFVENQMKETNNAGYKYYFESAKEFEDYVSASNVRKNWYASHPVGALIHVKGSKDVNAADNISVYPYMIFAPAASTLWTVQKYEQYRFRGSYDEKFFDGNKKFQAFSYNTTTWWAFTLKRRLNSCSLFMVENFNYFRTYSTSPNTGEISESLETVKSGSLWREVGAAAKSALTSTFINVISFGFIDKGDLTPKITSLTNYEYRNGKYESKTYTDGTVIPFDDVFFQPMEFEPPDITDYSNSQIDYIKGKIENSGSYEHGSNKVVNTDSGSFSNNKEAYQQIMQNEFDQLLQYSNYVYRNGGEDLYDCDGALLDLSRAQEAAYGGLHYDKIDMTEFDWLNKTYEKIIGPYLGPGAEVLSGGRSGLRSFLRGKKYGSGFMSQYDPRYGGKHYGRSNIADIGCGPAAATNMVAALGGHLSMDDAIAAGRKYTNGAGTEMDYFDDVLGQSGYSTNALSNPAEVASSLAQNKPVVMLGQDPTNTSKAYSSFGPKPHYVVGTGLNPDGTVNVLDSENPGPMSYNLSKLLNGTIAALNASGAGSGLYGGATMGFGPKGVGLADPNDKYKTITDKLKTKKTDDSKTEDTTKKEETTKITDDTNASVPTITDDVAGGEADGGVELSGKQYVGITGILQLISDKLSAYTGSIFGNRSTNSNNPFMNPMAKYYTKYNNSLLAEADKHLTSSIVYDVTQGDETTKKIAQMLNAATLLENKEQYSQAEGKRGNWVNVNGKQVYHSDCSEFAGRMYKNYLNTYIGGDTQSQLRGIRNGNVKGVKMVDDTHLGNRTPFLSKLKPGDLLYFRTKGHRGGQDSDVSHVEIYYGDGKLVGQRAAGPNINPSETKNNGQLRGSGPTITPFADIMYSGSGDSRYDRYIGTARFGDGATPVKFTGNNYTAGDLTYKEGDSVPDYVWKYLKSQGFTDEAAAGIMGNIERESSFNPKNITVEPNAAKNEAAGLFQWHDHKSWANGNYTYVDKNGKTQTQTPERFGTLVKRAKEAGVEWTDPGAQMDFALYELMSSESRAPFWFNLRTSNSTYKDAAIKLFKKKGLSESDAIEPADFKNLKNVEKAASLWDAGFEGSGDSLDNGGTAKRIEYANKYYKKYAGSGSGLFGGRSYAAEQAKAEGKAYTKYKLLGPNGEFATLYPSEKQTPKTKKHFEMIKKAIALNNTEQYSQKDGKRGNNVNGIYYSDCSEFANRMYKNTFGIDIGTNTEDQVTKIRNGKIPGVEMVVWDTEGKGRVPYINDLHVGDLMYFKTKGFRNGKAEDVTHVELYAGDGYIIGQDALGPNIDPKEMSSDGKSLQGSGPTYRLLDSIRPEGYTEMFSNARYSSGKRIEDQPLYDRFLGVARYTPTSGGRSGLLSFKKATLANNGLLYNPGRIRSRNLYGGASAALDTDYVARDTKKMLDNIQTAIINKGNSGEMSQSLVTQLLMAIVEILRLIATNTSSVGNIYSTLSKFNLSNLLTGSGSGATTAATRGENKPTKRKFHQNGKYNPVSSFEPSAALQTLVNGLASFAKG